MTTLWQSPLIVISFVAWLMSPPTGLADAAAREAVRRALVAPPVRALTNSDLPPGAVGHPQSPPAASPTAPSPEDNDAPMPAAAATGSQGPAASTSPNVDGGGAHDEGWWRDRLSTARAAVDQDEVLAAAVEARIGALNADIAARDDPYQRAKLQDDLGKATAERDRLQKQMTADRHALDAIQEEGRRAGVPAGWLR